MAIVRIFVQLSDFMFICVMSGLLGNIIGVLAGQLLQNASDPGASTNQLASLAQNLIKQTKKSSSKTPQKRFDLTKNSPSSTSSSSYLLNQS